jgi:hypothetical protein
MSAPTRTPNTTETPALDPDAALADLVEHARAIAVTVDVPHGVRSFARKVLQLDAHLQDGGVRPVAWSDLQ